MKHLLSFSFFVLLFVTSGLSQSKKEKKAKAPPKLTKIDSLQKKLSGIKYIDLGLSKTYEDLIVNNSNSADAQFLIGIVNYLKQDLRLEVIVSAEQRKQLVKIAKSKCDIGFFDFEIGQFKSNFAAVGNYPFTFSFIFCDSSKYSFVDKIRVNGLSNYANSIRNTCYFNFQFIRKYNQEETLICPINDIVISKNAFYTYIDTALNKKPVEGVYRLFSSNSYTSNYTVGVFAHQDTLKIIYFEGADFSNDWREGEIKGYLTETMSPEDYLLTWYSLDKKIILGSLSFLNKNSFEVRINSPGFDNGVDKFVRIK